MNAMDSDYEKVFCSIADDFDVKKAMREANRCYYCYDAPCITACPTGIDIPSFIRKISNGNNRGAALDILSANIMGGTCARACPVETLCEAACVREKSEKEPVTIGQLQKYAVDEFLKTDEKPFRQAKPNGLKVAVIGAGPAGLSCAHQLSLLGYDVSVFEAQEKPGGLNEYGLAPYKLTNNFAQKEIEFILSVGGIKIENNKKLGRDFTLTELKAKYSAVFLGIGLTNVNSLGIPGEDLPSVIDAVTFIAKIRQTKDLQKIPVTQNIVVIGGGNTAVDIAIEMKKLGADNVTIVYRRGLENMSATHHEIELAKKNGVLIKTNGVPKKITKDGVEFETFTLRAEQIFKAIGQKLNLEVLGSEAQLIENKQGKVLVNSDFETSLKNVFAGGDCTGIGEDLTVTAVQQGKLAALGIHKKLKGDKRGQPNL
ncbi:MAG: NAD(P)-dependent oxidoreductase [Pseudomonadota bacterium]|nr:NAD(P)-dependent oxidoreductase [Pseudomonadota bacterium]